MLRLHLSYLGEVGSVELYRRQSLLTGDSELAEHLSAFIEDEGRHAGRLRDMILESGGRASGLDGVTRLLFSAAGAVSAYLGVKAVLALNIMLERSGVDLYTAATRHLPEGEHRSAYQRDFSQMIDDERKHQTWFQQKRELVGRRGRDTTN